MKNKLRQTVLFAWPFFSLLAHQAKAADFTVTASELSVNSKKEAACNRLIPENELDERKVAAYATWVGLCRPALSSNILALRGKISFRATDNHTMLGDSELSPSDVFAEFLKYMTPHPDFSFDSEIRTPSEKLPMLISSFPLLTYTAEGTIKVWTGFPQEMPIVNFLGEPSGYKLFCESAILPSVALDVGASAPVCDLPVPMPVPVPEVEIRRS